MNKRETELLDHLDKQELTIRELRKRGEDTQQADELYEVLKRALDNYYLDLKEVYDD